jgi:hypothetical protein
MLAVLIAILLSLGVISTESEYHELSETEQEHYESTIITEDAHEL